MRDSNRGTIRPLLLAALLAVGLSATAAWGEGFQESRNFDSGELVINNLIGRFTIQGGGSQFAVRVDVQGRDASRERVQLVTSRDALSIAFPTRESSNFTYPLLGSGRTRFQPSKDEGWLSSVLSSLTDSRISVSGRGKGLEIWADVEVTVPAGKTLKIYHGVGQITAENVDGELLLSTHSGEVAATSIRGDLTIDTGSGAVDVTDLDGRLSADTGSGRVSVTRARGPLMHIDTGSGSVELEEVDSPKLQVDTGSGSVTASGVLTDSADIDTGSGSVTLDLERMGEGSFRVDTGSGRITLGLPVGASADVEADTGSGSIDIDLAEGVTLTRSEKDSMRFRVGGGAAKVQLDTGSGGIRVRRSP